MVNTFASPNPTKADRYVTDVTPRRSRRQNNQIKEAMLRYFREYPHSSAKSACSYLKLPYREYGGWVRKVKHDYTKWLRTVENPPTVTKNGHALTVLPSSHHAEFVGHVPAELIERLRLVSAGRSGFGVWYRSVNRNRQWCFRSSDVVIYVFPKSETCRVRMTRPMNMLAFTNSAELAFAQLLPQNSPLASHKLIVGFVGDMLEEAASRHCTFPIGPVTPFKNTHYKSSLGLVIGADGSHPESLETWESTPPWAKRFVKEVISGNEATERAHGRISGELRKVAGLLEQLIDLENRRLELETRRLELEQALLGSNGSTPTQPTLHEDLAKPDGRQFA